MLEFRRVVNSVAVICFTIALGVYIFADKYLGPLLVSSQPISPMIPIIVFALSALGVYSTVFSFLMWFYQRHLHVKIFRIYDLAGKWYHIGVIEQTSSVRHGTVHIVSDVDGIKISGLNYREDGSFSSSWQSETVAIIDRKLVLLYVSEGVAPEHPITRGSMVFNLTGSPPVQMAGVWNDIAPFTNRGTLTIFRNHEEYEERLEVYRQVRKETGEPQHSAGANGDTDL